MERRKRTTDSSNSNMPTLDDENEKSASSFEVESLLPSSASSVHRKVLGGRIKSLLQVVCVLVFMTLFYDLLVGETMTTYFASTVTDKRAGPSSTSSRPTTSLLVPTPAPTTKQQQQQVTQQPTHLRSGSSSFQSGAAANTSSTWISTVSDPSWLGQGQSDSDAMMTGPLEPPPPLISNASQVFADRWCDLQGVDWYPTGDYSWQRRAPRFLIPGAKYSGTFVLAGMLEQHPQIVAARSRELAFFYQANFQRYVTTSDEKTKVLAARHRMYALRDYDSSSLKANTSLMSLDATPGYLFYSSILPRRILCVLPWIQLVVVLRNPVDRLWDHYRMAVQKGLKLDFESWVEKDLELMKKVGLVQNWTKDNTFQDFHRSKEQDVAWYEYQSSSLEGAVGRSMYEIQLRQWFQALRAVGRDPAKDVYVVQAEDLAAHPQAEYNGILEFLGLPDYKLEPAPSISFSTNQTMKPEMRQRLQDFFQPYNRRLNNLLRRYHVPTGGAPRRNAKKKKDNPS